MQVSETTRKSPGAAPERATDTGPSGFVVLQLATVRVSVPDSASLTTTVPKFAVDGVMVSGPVDAPVRLKLADPLEPPTAPTAAVLASFAVP